MPFVAVVREYLCSACGRLHDEADVLAKTVGVTTVYLCPTCFKPAKLYRTKEANAVAYPKQLVQALAYPFRPVMAVVTAIVCAAVLLVSFFPLLGNDLAAAMIVSFSFAVIRATALGKAEPDPGAEEGGRSVVTWFGPLLRSIGVLLLASGPAVLLLVLLPDPYQNATALPAAVVGFVYLPAGLSLAAHRTGVAALNPALACERIRDLPRPYALTVGFVTLVAALTVACDYGAQWLLFDIPRWRAPILRRLVRFALASYGAAIVARLIGLFDQLYEQER